MEENLRELVQLRDSSGFPDDRAEYLARLAHELQHIVSEIARAVGQPVSDAVAGSRSRVKA